MHRLTRCKRVHGEIALKTGATDGLRTEILKGELAPVVGTICMDLCLADVTDIPGVSGDDEEGLVDTAGGLLSGGIVRTLGVGLEVPAQPLTSTTSTTSTIETRYIAKTTVPARSPKNVVARRT